MRATTFSSCLLVILLLLIALPLTAWALPNSVAYTINARLDTTRNIILGDEVVQFTNHSGTTLTALYFHVYPNAFKRGAMSHYQQDLLRLGVVRDLDEIYANPSDDAFMTISSVQSGAQRLSFTVDDTMMQVQLGKPLADGAGLQLHLVFIDDLLEVPAAARMAATLAIRSGWRDSVYTIALWYPKLAVYDELGWHLQQYSYIGEFYTDFGDYTVSIKVPQEMEVGATGALLSEVKESVSKTLHFEAKRSHDFAWVASARYHLQELQLGPMTVRALTLDIPNLGSRTLTALQFYEKNFGPYAYPVFTLAQVTVGGGMEYPAIVMIGEGSDLEIAHEVAHQWWYGAVGDDEFDEAWLDEAFATFSSERYLIAGLHYAEDGTRSSSRYYETGYPILEPASQFPSLSVYAEAVYVKGSGLLWMLRGLLEAQTLDKLLQAYYERFRYQNAKVSDFIAVAEEVSGEKLDWFFDEWLRTTKTLDFSIEAVSSTRQSDGNYLDRFTIESSGEAIMPVKIAVTLADGSRVALQWSGQGKQEVFSLTTTAPLRRIVVDPDRLLLEENRANNIWDASLESVVFPLPGRSLVGLSGLSLSQHRREQRPFSRG